MWSIRTLKSMLYFVGKRGQSRPDEYYGRRGEWISWDHFLLGKRKRDIDDDFNGEYA
jgi:hypothetical protein